MACRRILIILCVILSLAVFIPSSVAESPQTDLKIITNLDTEAYLSPALSHNNTFVYNNFQFHLYAKQNNTPYSIIVDNITIASRTIKEFKTVFYWETSKSRINKLEIYIGNDSYIYSGIFVYSYSIENVTTVDDDPSLIKFTKEELAQYLIQVELKAVGIAFIGGCTAFYIFFRLVKKRKEGIVKRIL